MNLYHILQTVVSAYDTYSNAVVAAPNEWTAQTMHPQDGHNIADDVDARWPSWASNPNDVTVHFLGLAADGIEQGVICSSFHAG